MKLTDHFSLEELVFSEVAERKKIDNKPDNEIITNLKRTAELLEKVRELLWAPIIISSGYRCLELNTLIGGSKTSAHMFGRAADFTCPSYGTPYEIAKVIEKSDIEYDQLIYEYKRWVHIGISDDVPRRQSLSIFDSNVGYLSGIINE